jgi:DNA polymerase-1
LLSRALRAPYPGNVTQKQRPRLFLVDGYALVYRAFHAVGNKPLTTSRGENTSIPWGIANFLDRLRKSHAPTYLGWVHDAGSSGRTEAFAGYKATRTALAPEQRIDFDRGVERVAGLLAAQRVPLLALAGHEADDVIATLARQGVAAGIDVVVVSPDKDLVQLVGDGIRILNPYHGRPGAQTEKWYDESNASERLGVPPHQVVDYLAMVGDSSDNIPGVKGIGEKGARDLLARWGSLDAILGHIDEILPLRARTALQQHIDDAKLSRSLVTLRDDLDIQMDLPSLVVGPPDLVALRSLYVELEFAGLARALGPVQEAPGAESGPKLRHAVVDTTEALDALVAKARSVGRFALISESELETGAPPVTSPMRSNLIALAIALAPGEAYYLPIAHRAPGVQTLLGFESTPEVKITNLPALDDARMRGLVELLEDASVPKITQNGKFDTLLLRRAGVQLRGIGFDTMIASYLLDPGRRSHLLEALSFDLLQQTIPTRDEVCGKGKSAIHLAEVTVERASVYGAQRADCTYRLFDHFSPRLGEQGLESLMSDLELPLIGVLAQMEWTGVTIDVDWFASLKHRFQTERQAVERRIWEAAGEEFNINSNPKLREILFEKLALPIRKRTATGPSTDASVLEELAEEGHVLPSLLMDYREVAKLESTYLDALPVLVNPRTGRLHTSYSQTVAATGRLSSSDPNLQNIPIRTEIGRDIRRGFVPRAGWSFLAADYSQIELRLLAHLSGDPLFVGAFRAGGDIHRQTAAVIFGVPVESVTGEMRGRAKTINFATIYGQGPFALSKQLKIEVDQAKAFISTYFERFAGVRQFLDESVALARSRGYAETIFGRRRYIPELRERNFNVRSFGERVAQNSPIQGSAADLIKRAMLRAAAAFQEKGFRAAMLLQVHDELVFEVPAEEIDPVRAVVVESMEGAATLSVPLVVDVGTGPNWLDAKAV